MSMPRIRDATSLASSVVAANLMPPALPRPPVCTWALTTTGNCTSRISSEEVTV